MSHIPSKTIHHICKLLDDPTMSFRAIARIYGIGHQSVSRINQKKKCTPLEKFDSMSDEEINQYFYPSRQSKSQQSETKEQIPAKNKWQSIHEDLQKRDVTMQLLWEEHRSDNPNGVSYSQFCRQYRKWHKTIKISLRQTHKPGDSLFIDFCGRTAPIRDTATNSTWFAQIFVGVLGASGYIFATAVKNQTTEEFLHAHTLMFQHLDGVPKYVVPDNLKAAVLKNTKETTLLNAAYSEFAEHYNFIILPARPRKPKDKSMAEIGVQIVQRWILTRLRHQTFFSLDELNQQIAYWLNLLNQRITRTYTVSRSERLEKIDREFLQRLPESPYSYSAWSYNQRVDESYHVYFDHKYYSVPYHYAYRLVDIKVNRDCLDIYWQRQLIASHNKNNNLQVITDLTHLPLHHRLHIEADPEKLIEWAEQMGPATKLFIENNLSDKRYFASKLKSIIYLRREVNKHNWQNTIEQSCQFIIGINCYSVQRLMPILKRQASSGNSEPRKKEPLDHENIRGREYYTTK